MKIIADSKKKEASRSVTTHLANLIHMALTKSEAAMDLDSNGEFYELIGEAAVLAVVDNLRDEASDDPHSWKKVASDSFMRGVERGLSQIKPY